MQQRIALDQLRVGTYIHLDLSWMDHPFGFSSFKIKSAEQIQTLRNLGLASVRVDLERSDVSIEELTAAPASLAAPAAACASADAAAEPAIDAVIDPILQAKRERQQKLARQREAIAHVERRHQKTASFLRTLQAGLQKTPAQSVADTTALAQSLADDMLAQSEISLYALLSQAPNPEPHAHALNVALLSLIIAREMQLGAEALGTLAQGALYHDVGLREVPSRILLKTDPLSISERTARDEHVGAGVRMARTLQLPGAVAEIIAHHHVMLDGSGYPPGRSADKVSALSRIVALVNHYDNLCNHVDLARSLTPHEALALMFGQQRARFDEKALQILIRCLGVYPPGTLVQLSNDSICVVSSVNTARPLKPMVVAYDARTPREAPIVIDLLTEADLHIRAALRRSQVPSATLEYLTGRGRVTYFYEGAAA